MTSVPHRTHRWRCLSTKGLITWHTLVLSLWLVVTGVVLGMAVIVMTSTHLSGGDFRNLWVGGWLLGHHLNPYSVRLGNRVFYRLSSPGARQDPTGPLPYLPWVIVLFAPLSYLPAATALWIWDALSFVAALALTCVWARTLGWTWIQAVAAGLAASTSTIACCVYILGQVPCVSFALLLAALALAYRGHYFGSGVAAMAASLVYYQLYWPVAVLLVAFAAHRGRHTLVQVAMGETVGLGALILLPWAARPALLGEWFGAVVVFGHHELSGYGMIGAVGLLSYLGPGYANSLTAIHTAVVTSALLGLAGLGYLAWRGRNVAWDSQIAVLLPLSIVAWATFSPYGHIQDLMLGVPLCMAMMGQRGPAVLGWPGLAGVWCLTVVPVLTGVMSGNFFLETSPLPLALLGLSVAGVLYWRKLQVGVGATRLVGSTR